MLIILATWEAEIRSITVLGQPGQKFASSHLILKKKSWAWWCISVIPATREAETGKDLIQGQPWAKSLRLYLKNN
jgi:hypothetical protein